MFYQSSFLAPIIAINVCLVLSCQSGLCWTYVNDFVLHFQSFSMKRIINTLVTVAVTDEDCCLSEDTSVFLSGEQSAVSGVRSAVCSAVQVNYRPQNSGRWIHSSSREDITGTEGPRAGLQSSLLFCMMISCVHTRTTAVEIIELLLIGLNNQFRSN